MSYEISGYGGDSDGADLVDFQFVPVAGTTKYNFCDPLGNIMTTDPASFTNGEDFTFDLAIGNPSKTYKWKIKEWNVGTTNEGKWSNNHKQSEFADDDDGEKGTFTAQSGMGEDAKRKPAKAY